MNGWSSAGGHPGQDASVDVPGAAVDGVDDPLGVDRHGDRLARLDVGQGEHVHVRAVGPHAGRREHVEGRHLLEARLLGRVEPDGQVEVARFELGDGLVTEKPLDEDVLDLRGTLEVVGVRLELGVLVGLVLDELVGARPDRLGRGELDRLDGLRVGVLEDVLGHDERRQVGQVADEVRVRRIERERDRVVVDDLHARCDPIRIGVLFDADHGGPGVLRVARGIQERAADRERDVVGRERRAVVPLDARMEVERPGQAVGTDLPGVGKVGDGLP